MTYLRRLNLANAFIKAAALIGAQRYTPVQLAELQSYLMPIKDARGSIRLSIESYLATTQAIQASTSSKRNEWVERCWDGVCQTYGD